MNKTYSAIFGDKPVEEALKITLGALEFESETLRYSSGRRARRRHYSDSCESRQARAEEFEENARVFQDISVIVPIPAVIDAISEESGIDYSWLKKLTGKYPNGVMSGLTDEQKKELIKLSGISMLKFDA